jgi:hypothetical protein
MPPPASLSAAVLHALEVASPSEAERLCLMMQSWAVFVNTASLKHLAPGSESSAAASSFLSAAASIITKRCCAHQSSALISHSIAASVFSGRAISFCLKHAILHDVRLILAGNISKEKTGSCVCLLKSGDVSVRRAVLKHCVDVIGARISFPPMELLELLVEYLPGETSPPLQRKCFKRVAEILQHIARDRRHQQQQQQLTDDTGRSALGQLHAAVTAVMGQASAFISKAVQHNALLSSSSSTLLTQSTLSEKSIQAAVSAASAAASAALTLRLPAAEADTMFQLLFDAVSGSIALSDHPDVAEACASAVGASGVMRHSVWAARFSSCLLGLLQVSCCICIQTCLFPVCRHSSHASSAVR